MGARWDGDGLNDEISQKTGISFIGGKGLTKQTDKDSADINVILRKYEKTGSLPDMILREPKYGDFSDVLSYQDALNLVMHAEEQFAALDAQVRKRFDNEPAEFLAFCNDPKNRDEMRKLGLLKPEEPAVDAGVATPSQPAPVEPAKGVAGDPK